MNPTSSAAASNDLGQAAAVPAEGARVDPVFDPGVLGDMFNHEPAVIAAVLQTFLSSTQASLSDINAALSASDLATVGLLAHKIKGASRMSGALALGRCAQDLEWAVKAGSLGAVREAALLLTQQWHAAQTRISVIG